MLKYWLLMGACLVPLLRPALYGQSVEFLPEIDPYVKLDTNVRFAFQARKTRERHPETSRDWPKHGVLLETVEESRAQRCGRSQDPVHPAFIWIPLPASL